LAQTAHLKMSVKNFIQRPWFARPTSIQTMWATSSIMRQHNLTMVGGVDGQITDETIIVSFGSVGFGILVVVILRVGAKSGDDCGRSWEPPKGSSPRRTRWGS